jgi:hypothetical protein
VIKQALVSINEKVDHPGPGACEKTEVQIKNGPQSLDVSKIRGKNKKNFEKCWSSIINIFFPIG